MLLFLFSYLICLFLFVCHYSFLSYLVFVYNHL
nr:MAG TPA: Protein of unknown function (DUF1201) [Caudoviricetes sp.]